MFNKAISVSIVIPVYRGERTVPSLYERLTAVAYDSKWDYEILFVEDAGPDNSWEFLSKLGQTDPRVRAIRLARNFGQHNALLCGIRAASKELIVTMDDDLQQLPEDIPKLLGRLDESCDVVYGRPLQQKHGILRNGVVALTKIMLQRVMRVSEAGQVSPFRVFRARLRGAFKYYQSPYVSVDVLLSWATSRFASIETTHQPRKEGSSSYNFEKLVNYAVNIMTGFSSWPLRLASIIGFIFTFFGFAVLVFVVGRYLMQGATVPGFPFLSSIIAIFAGAQLFALGIIGEYLARLHIGSIGRPCYVVAFDTRRGALGRSDDIPSE